MPRRPDPDRRARVLDAAAALFARRGVDAPMPEVARAAGVGVATVYRQFPSKVDLLLAVARQRLAGFEARLRDAAGEADPWRAIVDLLWAVAETEARDRLFGTLVAHLGDGDDLAPERASIDARLDALVARAREQGRLHPDVTARDLGLAFAAVAAFLALHPDDDDGWRRLLRMTIRGLEARPAP